MPKILKHIWPENYQNSLFREIGHTLRNDDEQPSKGALQWNPQGNRGMWNQETSGKDSL
jgi:hypothetical protein